MQDNNFPKWTNPFIIVLLLFLSTLLLNVYFNHIEVNNAKKNTHIMHHWVELVDQSTQINIITTDAGKMIHKDREARNKNMYQEMHVLSTILSDQIYNRDKILNETIQHGFHQNKKIAQTYQNILDKTLLIQNEIKKGEDRYTINAIESAFEDIGALAATLVTIAIKNQNDLLYDQMRENQKVEKIELILLLSILLVVLPLIYYGFLLVKRIISINKAYVETQQNFELARQSGGFGMWDWNIETNHLSWDDMMFKIYETDPKTFGNSFQDWAKCVLPEDAANTAAKIEGLLSDLDAQVFYDDFRGIRSDGTIRFIKANGYIIRDKNGKATRMIGINYDITDEKNLENNLQSLVYAQTEELRAEKNKAESANEAKSRFLSNMTHELRTPLNGIIGMLQLLKHHNLPAEHRELVMVMDDGASMLLKIVNDILDFSKIEANEIQLENIGFDLVSVISKITMSMEPLVENKNLWMQTIFPKEDLPPVLGDPLRIGQIVSNLLSNALKYTQQGGIIVSLATTKKNNKLQFLCRVTDTGIGIASDKLDMIFQKFTQADDSTTRRFGGTGLGLSITKELVELMGGEINVSSTDNKGSSFWFTLELPITDHLHEDRVTQQQTRQRLCKSAIPIHEARFLVAEDHPLNQILIKKLLERMQPKSFMIVDNGAKALQAMQNEIYDIVLMDIHMPVMNGYNATTNRRLWEKENNLSHLPIIATTANAFAGESQKCMDAGMDDYIVKPIMESVLYEVLSQWIVFDEQQSFTYEETGENNTVPVDLALLKSFSDGDEDFEHLSIAVFLEQTDRHFEQLQNRITHDNTEQWVDIAHMLKGASGSIGAQQLKLYAVQAQLEYYQTQEKRQMIFDLLRTEYTRVDAYFTMLGYSRRTQH